MTGNKRKDTLSMGLIEDQPGFDTTDLRRSPLVELVAMTGFINGIKNPLKSFESDLQSDLITPIFLYETALESLARLSEIDRQGPAGKNMGTKISRVRNEISETINSRFKKIFEFVVDALDDQLLQKMGQSISQREVADILYARIADLEKKYELGTACTTVVKAYAIDRAKKKSEHIVRNVEGVQQEIDGVFSGTFRRNREPLPSSSSREPYISPMPLVQKFPKTLRPAGIIPVNPAIDSEAEGATANPRYITGDTIRFNGFVPTAKGSWQEKNPEAYARLEKEAEEIARNSAFEMMKAAPALKTAALPKISVEEIPPATLRTPTIETKKEVSYFVDTNLQTKSVELKTELPSMELEENENQPTLKSGSNEEFIDRTSGETMLPPPGALINLASYVEATKPQPPKSWFQQKKDAVLNTWNSAKNVVSNWWTNKVKPFARAYAKPVALAAAVGATSAVGLTDNAVSRQFKLVDSSSESTAHNAPKAVDSSKTEAPVASTFAVKQAPAPVIVKVLPPAPAEKAESSIKFADVLIKSKSPIVQQIIKEKKMVIADKSITDSMTGAFRGLATDAQKIQIEELNNQINIGIQAYYNECFGTPEKITESLKNPQLKNLYKTARYSIEKGWVSPHNNKVNFPEAYEFAKKLLADSSELGHDDSDSPDATVKASVKGNMFQAKHPGSTIKLMKANGHFHVVTEYMIRIFEGEDVKKMIASDYSVSKPIPAGVNKVNQQPGQPTILPIVDKDKHGTFMPNIAPQYGFGLNNVDSLDKGWDEIIDKSNQLDEAKNKFDKDGVVEFQLPLTMTTYEENQAILPTVIEQIVAMNPQADASKVRKLLKQFGFIGIKKYERVAPGRFKVVMHPNFLKILKPQLKKSIV